MKQLLLMLLWLLPEYLLAQTGTLAGTVRDEQQRPVPFASVAVPAVGLGATADAQGAFSIANVPAGPVRVLASAVGYTAATRTVTLAAGETLTLPLTLAAAPAALADVVVTGVSR